MEAQFINLAFILAGFGVSLYVIINLFLRMDSVRRRILHFRESLAVWGAAAAYAINR